MAYRGYFNKYLKGKPFFEILFKDINHGFRKFINSLAGRKIRLLCFPHYPSTGATIFRVAKKLGIEVTNLPTGQFDLAIYWEYATIRSEWQVLESVKNLQVLNLHSRNISKSFVDQMHLKAFGYNAEINPGSFNGKAVRKSDTNAVHDGQIVQCPIASEPGFFYMKLIDSSVSSLEVMDMRIPIIGKTIPHLYRAYRSTEHRFVNVPPRVELEFDVDKWISHIEKSKLLELAELLGMDYCEFDTLRDSDGKLYVVDANNTPQGPPKNLTKREKKLAVHSLANAFHRAFIETSHSV